MQFYNRPHYEKRVNASKTSNDSISSPITYNSEESVDEQGYVEKYQVVPNFSTLIYLRDTPYNDRKIANFILEDCSFDMASK